MHCTVHLHGTAVLSAFLRGLVSRTQSCVYNKRITPDLTLSLALFSFLQILLSGLPLYFVLLLLLLFLYLSSKLIDSLHLVGFFFCEPFGFSVPSSSVFSVFEFCC